MERATGMGRGIIGLALVSAAVGFLPSLAAATIVTITSSNFSIGLGYTSAQTWNNSETSAANTPTVQGDFTFTPVVTATNLTTHGPFFPNRVLTTGNQTSSQSAYTNTTNKLNATITAQWNGVLSPYYVPGTLAIQTNITGINVYAVNYVSAGTFRFDETTVGHTSSSSPTVLLISPDIPTLNNPAVYTKVLWDPNDFSVAGSSQVRTFSNTYAGIQLAALDGFAILGNVTVTYETPEPASLALVAIGLALLPRTRLRAGAR